jgi:hypothetical protein
MASGKLGSVLLPASVNTVVYAVPANTVATVNLNICNKGTVDVHIYVGLTEGTTWGLEDAIEYGIILGPKDVLERTGIVLQSGKSIMVSTNVANIVTAVAWGFEETV